MLNLIQVNNARPVTTSRKIASIFNKEHKNVIRDIKSLECSLEFSQLNFEPSDYTTDRGKTYQEYIITRDGFTLLAMGFTGKEAMKFKEAYIKAFNEMEQSLRKPKQLSRIDMARMVIQAEEERMKLEEEKRLLTESVEKNAPKVNYHDKVLNSNTSHLTNTIAKELGMSARALNKLLAEKKIQYKQRGTWVLTAKYQAKGFMKSRTYTYLNSRQEECTSIKNEWTEKGRRFIHSLFSVPKTLTLG